MPSIADMIPSSIQIDHSDKCKKTINDIIGTLMEVRGKLTKLSQELVQGKCVKVINSAGQRML